MLALNARHPFIPVLAAAGTVLGGWLASQTDRAFGQIDWAPQISGVAKAQEAQVNVPWARNL